MKEGLNGGRGGVAFTANEPCPIGERGSRLVAFTANGYFVTYIFQFLRLTAKLVARFTAKD